MPNKIILKKSSVASKVPLATDLEIGEIAVNLADQKLYSKNASGTVVLVGTGTATGTVTSVGMTVPTGLTVSGSPVTTSGTLAVSLTSGYSIPTTASQSNWDTAYNVRQQWNGGSTNLVAATGRTSLGGTTVGQNFFTLANPSAITFPRINADNSVSSLSAADFRTAIGAGTGNGTVTSVTGTSPVASSGGATPAISLASGYGDTQNPFASKTAKYFLAAPNASAGAPTFRAIVASDIPTLNQNTTGSSGSCTGNAATATTLQTARTINGVSFNGSANITVTANTTNTLTRGSYLTGNNFNGSAATTWAVDATTTATASKIVARDANGDIYSRYDFCQYVNMSHSAATRNTDTVFYSSTDAYIRKNTADGFRTSLAVPKAGAGGAIVENTNTIAANYTMTTGSNGMSAGPVSVDSGVTVTIPTGSTWVIV